MEVFGSPEDRAAGDGVQEEAEEDFYGYNSNADSAHETGAPSVTTRETGGTALTNDSASTATRTTDRSTQISAPSVSDEQRKVENQQRAQMLRAKLMAQRQNTPARSVKSRSNTPAGNVEPQAPPPQLQIQRNEHEQKDERPQENDLFGLEALLTEGKAAAEAKKEYPSTASEALTAPLGIHNPNDDATSPAAKQHDRRQKEVQHLETEKQQEQLKESSQPKWSTRLTDAYYADLPLWLEVTGYHDVEYRNSKLQTHRERQALEQEAARIAERLGKLKQAEQNIIISMRNGTHNQPNNALERSPPTLPAIMPSSGADMNLKRGRNLPQDTVHSKATAKVPAQTNGIKRARSPEPNTRVIRRKEMNECNSSPLGPGGTERRISYPEPRRPSLSGAKRVAGREPSLERRPKLCHRRDSGPHDVANEVLQDNGRLSYSSVNLPRRESGNRSSRPRGYEGAFRDRNGYNGATRYFMIKSWNHENVKSAMHEGLWATQQKNEELLTEAYHTSARVVLLFSVNKSVAFQGYAIMTSPPTPSFPKPSFCAQLRWSTSAAFTVRWIVTTPVHYRYVGHIKNEFNLDDDGSPHAVLIGKDGQEMSNSAGAQLVEKLEEAERAGIDKMSDWW